MKSSSFTFDQRLDSEYLETLYEDDVEYASMIFTQFLETAPTLMNEIENSYTAGTVEIFRQKVHKLKPAFSYVGLTQLTVKAETLEKKCKEVSNISSVSDLYRELKSGYSENITIIENEVKRLNEQLN